MSGENESLVDVYILMHSLLFSYQKSAKSILGESAEIFINPSIHFLLNLEKQERIAIVTSKTLEEALSHFADMLVRAKVVKACSFKKITEDIYTFKVDGCIWAKRVHSILNPKDVTCPYGLVAMALYSKFTGNEVKENESIYIEDGCETQLAPFFRKTSKQPV